MLILTVGVVVTFMVTVLTLLIQPFVDPVMLYTEVEIGVNVLVFPEPDGNHV